MKTIQTNENQLTDCFCFTLRLGLAFRRVSCLTGSDWPGQGHWEAAAESPALTSWMSHGTEAGTRCHAAPAVSSTRPGSPRLLIPLLHLP